MRKIRGQQGDGVPRTAAEPPASPLGTCRGVRQPPIFPKLWRYSCHVPSLTARARHQSWIWALLGVGLLFYNWWIAVLFLPDVFALSPHQMYSDLQVDGAPHARLLQGCDQMAGAILIVVGTILTSRLRNAGPALEAGTAAASGQAGERPVTTRHADRALTSGLIVVGVAVLSAGTFPFVCAESTTPGCRKRQWAWELPWQQYVHSFSGTVEFIGIWLIIISAWVGTSLRRSQGRSHVTRPAWWPVAAAVTVLTTGVVDGIAYMSHFQEMLISSISLLCWTVCLVFPMHTLTAPTDGDD